MAGIIARPHPYRLPTKLRTSRQCSSRLLFSLEGPQIISCDQIHRWATPRHTEKDKTMQTISPSGEPSGGAEPGLIIALHRGLLKCRVTEETLARRYREQEMRNPAHFGTG